MPIVTRKRKTTSEAGPSTTTRQRRVDPPPPLPPLAPPLPSETRTLYYTRKCKLGPLLRQEFTLYKVCLLNGLITISNTKFICVHGLELFPIDI